MEIVQATVFLVLMSMQTALLVADLEPEQGQWTAFGYISYKESKAIRRSKEIQASAKLGQFPFINERLNATLADGSPLHMISIINEADARRKLAKLEKLASRNTHSTTNNNNDDS